MGQVIIDAISRDDSLRPCDPWVEARVATPDQIGDRTRVVISIPTQPINPGDILCTMWEASRISPDAVANCNKARCVVVTCDQIAGWFRDSGVTSPIRVVPLGLDLDIFRHIDTEPEGKVVFGAAGRTSHGGLRKGLAEVVEAFRLAFPPNQDDVELRIKVWEDCVLPAIEDPRIIVDRRALSDRQIAHWLRDLSCFVSASRGEGWSFWFHQSLAVGRPVIAPLFGGPTAYAAPDCAYPVEYDLEEVPDNTPHYGGCGAKWAVPRIDSLVYQLWSAYEDHENRIERGYNGADRAAAYSWDRAGRELAEVLREFEVMK